MDEGQIEQSGGIFGRLIKRKSSKEITTPSSNFEQELFRGGVYHFDFDKELSNSEGDYRSYKGWLDKHRTPDRANRSLQDFIGSERHEIMWKQFFDGVIPKRWGEFWGNPMKDLEEAGKRKIQLSEPLVSAGVSHSHHLVANRAGKNQRLNPEQLGLILVRDDIPAWNSNEVLDAQKAKGMTGQEISKARKIASEIKARMRRKKTGQDKIEQPKPRLRSFNRSGGD